VISDSVKGNDLKDSCLYVETTTGEVYSSVDNGNTWKEIAKGLGRIQGFSFLDG